MRIDTSSKGGSVDTTYVLLSDGAVGELSTGKAQMWQLHVDSKVHHTFVR